MSTISASTTSTTAFKITTDTTGALVFQTGASPTTAMTLGSDQSVTFAGTPTYSGGTANGVAYLNGSKVLTTGTALVFDGSNLGVGVTPSAWGASFKATQIGVTGSIYANNGNIVFANNIYHDGTNPRYIATGVTTGSYLIGGNAHYWYSSGAGTAGNVITSTQAMTLDASGRFLLGTTTASDFTATIYNTSSTSAGIQCQNSSTGTGSNNGFYVGISGSGTAGTVGYVWNCENDRISFGTNNTEVARIDSSGRLTVPNTPMFSAVANGNGLGASPANGSLMPFPTVLTNVGSSYNSSTYRFTAPIAGTYFFSASISPGNVSASNQWVALRPRKNGSIIAADVYSLGSVATFGNNSYATCAVSFTLTLAANDYVDCIFEYNTFNGNVNYGLFTGFLVG